MKTLSKILNVEFEFTTNHLGLFVNDDLWVHDKYVVIINGETFDYHTGIGIRIEKDHFNKKEFQRIMAKNPKQTKENLLLFIDELKKVSKPKPLEIDDVLCSIISDATCVNGNDFEDFCSEFGYDTDSIKANETYKECQKNAKKVKKFISDLDKANELFSEY